MGLFSDIAVKAIVWRAFLQFTKYKEQNSYCPGKSLNLFPHLKRKDDITIRRKSFWVLVFVWGSFLHPTPPHPHPAFALIQKHLLSGHFAAESVNLLLSQTVVVTIQWTVTAPITPPGKV